MVMEQSVLMGSPNGRYLKSFVEVERSAPWSVVLMGRSLMILVGIAGALPAWDVFRFRDGVEAGELIWLRLGPRCRARREDGYSARLRSGVKYRGMLDYMMN
jgi:hypothetical protein